MSTCAASLSSSDEEEESYHDVFEEPFRSSLFYIEQQHQLLASRQPQDQGEEEHVFEAPLVDSNNRSAYAQVLFRYTPRIQAALQSSYTLETEHEDSRLFSDISDATPASVPLNTSTTSVVSLWDHRPPERVDQSINLMDPMAATYDNASVQETQIPSTCNATQVQMSIRLKLRFWAVCLLVVSGVLVVFLVVIERSSLIGQNGPLILFQSTRDNGKSFRDNQNVSLPSSVTTTSTAVYEVTSSNIKSHDDECTTSKNSKERLETIHRILIDSQIAWPDDLDDEPSSSYQAWHWISEQDPTQLYIPEFALSNYNSQQRYLNTSFVEAIRIQQLLQRYALATFYFSMVQMHIPNQFLYKFLQTTWLSEEHVCEWKGIDCQSENHYGDHIKSLDACTSPGTIPQHPYISSINLANHFLTGTLPQEWFLPGFMVAMPRLKRIDLSQNRIHGTFPPNIFVKDPETSLAHNIIDALEGLGELVYIDISQNRLMGSLPESIPPMFSKVETLLLDHNHLYGTLPTSMTTLANLKILSLHHNEMKGTLPSLWTPSLNELRLHRNAFRGQLPSELGSISDLQGLYVDSNELTGSVPASFGHLQNLERLLLFGNQLTAAIPSEVCQLRNKSLISLAVDCLGKAKVDCDCCSACY